MGAPRLAHSRLPDRQKKAFISLLLIMPVVAQFLTSGTDSHFTPVFRCIAIQHVPIPLPPAIIRIEKVPVLSHEDRCVGWSVFESTEGTLRVQSGVLPLS
jgi:hypothetical protein